jgi:two-component system, NtrC family, nitrogen regulation response regulator GlnG
MSSARSVVGATCRPAASAAPTDSSAAVVPPEGASMPPPVVAPETAGAEFDRLVDAALPSVVQASAAAEPARVYRAVMARIERPLLRHALDLSGGNQLRAARLLGINRNTLRKRLRQLGLLPGPAAAPDAH